MDAELVANASNIAVGVSAVVIAGVAFFGINRWRQELKGKARFEVARNVMTLAYTVQADLKWLTFPITRSEEYYGRPIQENENPDVSALLNEWYARKKRLVPLIEDLPKLEEAGWEAEIVLNETSGSQVKETITVLKRRYAQTRVAIDEYFDLLCKGAKGADTSNYQELLTNCRNKIYSTEGDDVSREIEQAMSKLSSALKIYIR